MKRSIIFAFHFAGILLFITTTASSVQAQSGVREQFLQLEKKSGGTLGVYAMHVETGRRVSYRENQFFPMASVYKIPIAIYYLNQVFLRKLSLTDTVEISKDLLGPEYSPLLRRWKKDGNFRITQGELLRQMVSYSDNTACDVLLQLAGGSKNVTRYFSAAGLNGFNVSRTEKQMGTDYLAAASPKFRSYEGLEIDSVLKTFSQEQELAIVKAYLNDRRDVSTPEGMGQLFMRIYRRTLPGFTDYKLLMKLLEDTPLGQNRIKAGVPAGATVAHKTGGHRTLAGVNIATNDAGIIALPGGGHVILVVFVKGSACGYDEVENIIAEVASLVTTAWLAE